ncbi:MAG: multidrug transporter [Clostridiales bacterium]|nr:multidrug transporter [Clostridiales bacterium]
MEKIVKEYMELLSGEGVASDKFWELEKQVKTDKRKKSVIMDMRRSEMIYNILYLIQEGAITVDDLDEFSEQIRGRVKLMTERW